MQRFESRPEERFGESARRIGGRQRIEHLGPDLLGIGAIPQVDGEAGALMVVPVLAIVVLRCLEQQRVDGARLRACSTFVQAGMRLVTEVVS